MEIFHILGEMTKKISSKLPRHRFYWNEILLPSSNHLEKSSLRCISKSFILQFQRPSNTKNNGCSLIEERTKASQSIWLAGDRRLELSNAAIKLSEEARGNP